MHEPLFALQVLRAHRDTILSVMDTFVHDPLVEWARGGGVGRLDAEAENPMAKDAMATIEGGRPCGVVALLFVWETEASASIDPVQYGVVCWPADPHALQQQASLLPSTGCLHFCQQPPPLICHPLCRHWCPSLLLNLHRLVPPPPPPTPCSLPCRPPDRHAAGRELPALPAPVCGGAGAPAHCRGHGQGEPGVHVSAEGAPAGWRALEYMQIGEGSRNAPGVGGVGWVCV